MDTILSLDVWLPYDAKRELAKSAKAARLKLGYKRETISQKTAIPVSTLKRFETTGEISLDQFLKLVFVLGDLQKLKNVFASEAQQYTSLEDIIAEVDKPKRQRGSR